MKSSQHKQIRRQVPGIQFKTNIDRFSGRIPMDLSLVSHSWNNGKKLPKMEKSCEEPNELFRLRREKLWLERELDNHRKKIEETLPALKRKREDNLTLVKDQIDDNRRKRAKLELKNVRLQYENKFLQYKFSEAIKNREKLQDKLLEEKNRLFDLVKENVEVRHNNKMILERNTSLEQERKRLEERLNDCRRKIKEQSHFGGINGEVVRRLNADITHGEEEQRRLMQVHAEDRKHVMMKIHEKYRKECGNKFLESSERLYDEFRLETEDKSERVLSSSGNLQNLKNHEIEELKERLKKLDSVNNLMKRRVSDMEYEIARQEARYIEEKELFERDMKLVNDEIVEKKGEKLKLFQDKQAREWEKIKYRNLVEWKTQMNDISENII